MCALLSFSSTVNGAVWQVLLPQASSRLFLGVQGKAVCRWHACNPQLVLLQLSFVMQARLSADADKLSNILQHAERLQQSVKASAPQEGMDFQNKQRCVAASHEQVQTLLDRLRNLCVTGTMSASSADDH